MNISNKRKKTHNKNRKKKHNKTSTNKTRKIKKIYKWVGGSRLEKGIKKDYNLFEININNDKPIYQIEYNDCKQYFYLPKNKEYLLLFIKEENKYILFNTKIDNDDIEETIYTKCLNIVSYPSNSYYIVSSRLKSFNILTIQKKCVKTISEDKLDAAKEEINKLNILLKEKCSNLSLNLNYVYNLKGNVELYSESYSNDLDLLVLCLYNKNNCISSIELILEDNNIVINSKTNKEFEGKKYNKLLRGVVIIISSLIPNINTIISYAGNIISAGLLIQYYNARIPSEIDENIIFYKFLEQKEDKTLTKQLLEEFKHSLSDIFVGLVLYIDLNKNNVEKAYKEVHNLLDAGIESTKQIQCI